ncbi:fumarate hydratase subunit alpha [Thermosulfidibacter takaii ABI70S6]|uniref:Fumarate hydratase subunit alpha n=1 Tax=Thermosulfidibacter takaii (strain DSM 17441 / JCM 13301 / NBRC 103674 / ABI70S6) TaxID=1298851 RepID=A0A0S3QTF8_THET7|nr:fumarate hydratase [Thermosulfidibacter takaii]BAT71585.1 fumarate hydratase subunit alpha [Thermosulfidibacter takaii ABI70S6]
MRVIDVSEITEAIAKLCIEANYELPGDVHEALKEAYEKEKSPVGKAVLSMILENAELARQRVAPICQDCGLAVLFIEIGQDVHFTGGNLKEAIYEGVRRGYKEGYLRKSTCHPFTRANVGDNTPPVIHYDIVPGDKVRIVVAPKGGGSENMSMVTMLKPADGLEGVIETVVNRVKEAGGNPCPPIIVGVGVGGTFERSAFLAKKALLRPVGKPNPDVELAKVEQEILERINKLGIGPMGWGGTVTALAVHFEMEPVHIASLPCAININCHAARHKEIII